MDPFILTKFIKPDGLEGDPLVSLVVFEWQDKNLVGIPVEGQGGSDEVGHITGTGTKIPG